ncbi:MAG: peptide ABC transporter substrate-binding protein [Oscillospiraceae bacterium]
MKKLSLMLAAVMMLGVVLTACGGSASSGAASGSGTASGSGAAGALNLVVQVGPNPETIDPALNTTVDGGNMLVHAFETLLIIDKDNAIQPGQAESYDVSEDGLTWTFHLRDGLKWSDGTDLTANDFVYSWKRIVDPDVAAPYAATVLGMVKGFDEAQAGDAEALAVSAPDDKTFVVELAKPTPYFTSLAAFATLSPVQEATVEANGEAWATEAASYVSNGPLYVTEWVPSSHITMSKNPNYWNADAITVESIKFMLMEDSNASYSAYQTGDVQMIKDVPTEEIPALSDNSEFHISSNMGTYYISMRNQEAPLNDPLVRQALSLAIDRDYVANTIMQGTYTPAYNFVGPGITTADGSEFMDTANGGVPYISEDYEANLAKAKELLVEAGYPNGEGLPAIEYATNDTAYHRPVAEYLQQAWKELGLTVDVKIVEWATFSADRRAGAYMSARNGWLFDYNDPSNMLENLATGNGNNDGKYSNPAYDKALENASITVDPDARFEFLHEAEDILMADMGVIPLAYYNDFYLINDNLTGWWHSPYGYWYFMYTEIAA